MGANWDDGVSVGKTAGKAFSRLTRDAAWEHGHGGYSGTMAEKCDFVMAGTLPARVTFQDFLTAMWRAGEMERNGYWVERVYDNVTYAGFGQGGRPFTRRECVKTIERRKDPLPKSMQNPAGRKAPKVFLNADADKWGPAAGIELNKKETKEVKGNTHKGKQGLHAYGFGGLCSA